MSEQPTCPRCDSPIQDTAYVCTRCADVLAVALRNAAANWDELEAAIAKQTAMTGEAGASTGRRTLEGPTDIPCHHGSCLTIRQSQLRAQWNEDPISGETNLVSFGALENGWIVTNTATTWARMIEEESGRPIPAPIAPPSLRADPPRVLVRPRVELHVVSAPRADLCDYSWLPKDVCACGHDHERTTA
ncbi:MAG: hypothetical protein ACXVX9_12185 [Mycobacteriaceae bacterium]